MALMDSILKAAGPGLATQLQTFLDQQAVLNQHLAIIAANTDAIGARLAQLDAGQATILETLRRLEAKGLVHPAPPNLQNGVDHDGTVQHRA